MEREVGSGGMARVFLGRDEVLDRPVAVKVLKPMHGETDIGIRFRREGRTAARLAHPNIVQVYDAGEAELDDREASYIVMEYLSGGDLKETIDAKGKLPGPELSRIGAEVCSGLAHAHGRGVVHRDIKPHNILLDDKGRAKVSDFGIARALDTTQATRTGAYLGTALYSSPEQLQGHKVTPKADVYALGATMYQAATGEPLFTGSPIEIASQHVSKPPEPPSQRDPDLDLDGDLEALILACLAKNAADRPTAEQAGSRFAEVTAVPVTDSEPEPTPTPPPPRTKRPRPAPTRASSGGRVQRRNRFPGILTGVALLAVLGVVGLLAAPSLFSQSGNTTQGSPSQNEQAAAGSDGGGQASRGDRAGDEVGSDGGNSGGNQNPQAAAEPTTSDTSSGTGTSSEPAGNGNSESDQQDQTEQVSRQGPSGLTEDAAVQTVEDHYEVAASDNYRDAWDFLSSRYQQDIGSQGLWVNQFSTLEEVEYTQGPTARVTEDTATVSFSTRAQHTGFVDRVNGAVAYLVRENGEWKIDSLEA